MKKNYRISKNEFLGIQNIITEIESSVEMLTLKIEMTIKIVSRSSECHLWK